MSNLNKVCKCPDLFGFNLDGYLQTSVVPKLDKNEKYMKAYVLGSKVDTRKFLESLKPHISDWVIDKITESKKEVNVFSSPDCAIFIVKLKEQTISENSFSQELMPSLYSAARDAAGELFSHFKEYENYNLICEFKEISYEQGVGFIAGLEISSYNFKKIFSEKDDETNYLKKYPKINFLNISEEMILEGTTIGKSINVTRHLVNLPGSNLDPQSYVNFVKSTFNNASCINVECWGLDKIKSKNMNLLEAVAKGSEKEPALVHLKYRPDNKSNKKPVALVGKGITFDSGGLDIKGAAVMQLMKKDMGGSAALVGLAYYLEQTKIDAPCDIYLSIAENAVSAKSMKPGDVYVSRSGQSVEIGNTDAEGRLVLADALDLALSKDGDDEPIAVIDLATLTGANRIGLGPYIAGMYSNNSELIQKSVKAAQEYGDPIWNMPLYKEYEDMYKSNVADFSNNSSDSRGGAIAAALFLKRFVKDKPWAHFDIYAWVDKPQGAFREIGANGQGVQLLIGLLNSL